MLRRAGRVSAQHLACGRLVGWRESAALTRTHTSPLVHVTPSGSYWAWGRPTHGRGPSTSPYGYQPPPVHQRTSKLNGIRTTRNLPSLPARGYSSHWPSSPPTSSPPPWLRKRSDLQSTPPTGPEARISSLFGRATMLLLTTVGYGSLLYVTHLLVPVGFMLMGLPQLSSSDWTPTLVITGSVLPSLFGLRVGISLRLLPAFVLSAAAYQLTTTAMQSVVKAEYAMHVKRSEGLWNKLFGGYSMQYNEKLGVYEYKRRTLFALLGISPQAEGPLLASLNNNAHCAAGVIAVGNRQATTFKEMTKYLLTGDARSEEEKLAVVEHEKGHADTSSFFHLLDLYVTHVFLQAFISPPGNPISNALASFVLAPVFLVSAWTLSAWCAEAVADMRAGRGGFNVKFQECAVTLRRNSSGEAGQEAHILRKLSLAISPPEDVHVDHTPACASGEASPCHGEIGPGAHPPTKWRYNAFLCGDVLYPVVMPVLSAVGSAVSLRPLIDPLGPRLDAAALEVMEEAERQEREKEEQART